MPSVAGSLRNGFEKLSGSQFHRKPMFHGAFEKSFSADVFGCAGVNTRLYRLTQLSFVRANSAQYLNYKNTAKY